MATYDGSLYNTSKVKSLQITNDTTSGATNTGALIVGGGAGIAKSLYVGGNIVATGTVGGSNLSGTNTGDVTTRTIGNVPNANGLTIANQQLYLQPADALYGGVITASNQSFGGTKTFTGNVNFSSNMYHNGTSLTSGYWGMDEVNSVQTSTEFQLLRSRNGAGLWGFKGGSNDQGQLRFKTHSTWNTPIEAMRIDDNQIVSIMTTTLSDATNTGALIVAGGIGCAKTVYCKNATITRTDTGTDYNVLGMLAPNMASDNYQFMQLGKTTDFKNCLSFGYYYNTDEAKTFGHMSISGSTGIKCFVDNHCAIESYIASTSAGTGALVVNGGIGASHLTVGGNVGNNIFLGQNYPMIGFNCYSNGSSYLYGAGSSSQIASLIRQTGTVFEILTAPAGNAGGVASPVVNIDIVQNTGSVHIYSTAVSDATNTGALIVGGGIGCAKSIYSGGDFVMSNAGGINKIELIKTVETVQASAPAYVCPALSGNSQCYLNHWGGDIGFSFRAFLDIACVSNAGYPYGGGQIRFITSPNNSTTGVPQMTIDRDGQVTLAGLAGTGNRTVMCDANGKLYAV